MKKQQKGSFLLLLTAMIWGMGFVAQKAGAELEPFTYNGIRMLLAGLVLLPIAHIMTKDEKKKRNTESMKGGFVCGLVLCAASNLQQFGLYFQTDAGKAGFITSLYILFVPIFSVFLGKKIKPMLWCCVALGMVGFYLLTMAGKAGGFTLAKGDFYVLLCAFVFGWHIIVVDYYAARTNGLLLSAVQFLVAGIISFVLMVFFESPNMENILNLWKPILYSGFISSGVGYTLQVLGQRDAEPTMATLVMSLESVFAVIFGVLILGEQITYLEGVGCIVIFTAVLLPQVIEMTGEKK